MTGTRRSTGIEEQIKARVYFEHFECILYFTTPIVYDAFCSRVEQVCKLPSGAEITMKVLDNEGDPCTVAGQNELDEVMWALAEARCPEMSVHAFRGRPIAPGAPCVGEHKNMYRQGARRWHTGRKLYRILDHEFEQKRLKKKNCAICADAIWGLGRTGLSCKYCGMCVHKKCHKLVRDMPCDAEQERRRREAIAAVADAEAAAAGAHINGAKVHPKQRPGSYDMKPLVDSLNVSPTAGGRRDRRVEVGNNQIGRNELDDFRMLKVIGRGSYAKVIQAEHRKTGEIYAIKVIKKVNCLEEDDIDWLDTEKNVFEAASNHPFLVGLHSCFQAGSMSV